MMATAQPANVTSQTGRKRMISRKHDFSAVALQQVVSFGIRRKKVIE